MLGNLAHINEALEALGERSQSQSQALAVFVEVAML